MTDHISPDFGTLKSNPKAADFMKKTFNVRVNTWTVEALKAVDRYGTNNPLTALSSDAKISTWIVIVVVRLQLSTKMRLTKTGIVRDISTALHLGQQKFGTVLKSKSENVWVLMWTSQ